MSRLKILSLLGVMCAVMSCSKDEDPTECTTAIELDSTPYDLDIAPFPSSPILDNIELTQSKVRLGRMLFYEPLLSLENNISCSSCHLQEDAFTDINQFSVGTNGEIGNRNAMAIINLAWNTNGFFWDGRSPTLAHQAIRPIVDDLEMDETYENVIAELSAVQSYKDQFIKAFGNDEIDEFKIGKALEQFMFTLVSKSSKYDMYLAGAAELSESEERGRQLYFTEYNEFFPDESGADCEHCHGGFNLENDLYMNNGLDAEEDFTDLGFYNVTNLDEDKAKFKVPTLRNIELTPPYMHDGRFQTLEEVVEHYNSEIHPSPSLDPALLATTNTGLMLTEQDKVDLVNFLKTFTDYAFIADERFSSPH